MRTVCFLSKLVCILIGLPCLLTGCWDRVEVNDLALITAAGIDKKTSKKIELSVQVFVPRSSGGNVQQGLNGGGGSSGGLTFVRSAEGLTIVDAMTKLQEKLPRRVFWGHTEVFIISRTLAEEGIRNHLDFMIRHPQVRIGAYVFISDNDAKRALELMPPLERSSSEVLRELAKSKAMLKVTLKDLSASIIGDSESAALPWITELPADDGKNKNNTVPYITGSAIFKKDKMVGHIDDTLTRGALWLRDEVESAVVTHTPKEANGFVSMKLIKARSELIPHIDNGKWSITLRGVTEDDIIQNATNLDLMNPKHLGSLELQLKQNIEGRVSACLEQVQKKMNADIFDFAGAFHRKYPKEWQQVKDRWDEMYPEVEVNFDLKAYVRRPGISTGPAGVSEDEVRD